MQTIGTLSRLCGLVPTVPLGLTDACRLVVRGAGVPVTPADVRQRLQSIGFDLSKYANDLAAIHTILKRLNESGELRFIPRGNDAGQARVPLEPRTATWSRSARTSPPSCATPTSSARRCGRTTSRRRRRPKAAARAEDIQEERDMTEIELRRRFFAEELEAVCKLRTPALVDAFARVPRDQFLPPGPWTVLSDSGESYMMGGGARTRLTPDADPARVHHNIAVAIDPERQLFNGQPGTLGAWIDALELGAGARVLHVGAGLGYYTAVMGECAGSTGRVARLRSGRSARGRGHAPARLAAVDRGAPRRRVGAARRTVRRDPRERRRHAPARHLARRARARRPH